MKRMSSSADASPAKKAKAASELQEKSLNSVALPPQFASFTVAGHRQSIHATPVELKILGWEGP